MKFVKKLFVVLAAGITAIAIVSAMLCFYSITPVHKENKNGNTDFIWPANSIWVELTEGISFGKYDENGYNNSEVVENPDIIVLGSSHMEATFVMQNQNAPYLLSQKLKNKYSVYNLAISGHHFLRVCQYLPANIELFEQTPKVVIIETSSVEVDGDSVNNIINGSVERANSYSNGIIGTLQNIPFCRCCYHQLEGGLLDIFANSSSTADTNGKTAVEEETVDEEAYDNLFEYFSQTEEQYNTQLVIFYHPFETLNEDGSISFKGGEYLKAFEKYAEKYNISFVDMTDTFEDMYYNEHHVPHGFCTGELATGHLNTYGHAAVAEELYNQIIKMEEDGELCQ